VARHVRSELALEVGRGPLGDDLAGEHRGAAPDRERHEAGDQQRVALGRAAIDDDRGNDEADQPGRGDDATGTDQARTHGQPQQAPRRGHAVE
jgi:hypothetical protein